MAIAERNIDTGTPIAGIHFKYGLWRTPGALTGPLAMPGQAHVIFDLEGIEPDILVQIHTDEDGNLIASDPEVILGG